jgi:ABC-2 type transport system permease protein
MNSLKACIKKEIMEGIKTHKFLIVAIGILFFAIADPVFLRLTPMILKSQFGGTDPDILEKFGIELSQLRGILNYANSLFQLGTLVTAFALAGLISSERSDKTLTIPASMGCKVYAVVAGKMIVYGLYCIIMTTVGMLMAYYYGELIFGPSKEISLLFALKAGFFYGLLFLVLITILVFFSSMVKKSFLAGIFTLMTVYLLSAAGPFLRIEKYLPSNLSKIATSITGVPGPELGITLLCSILLVAALNIITISRLKRVELV